MYPLCLPFFFYAFFSHERVAGAQSMGSRSHGRSKEGEGWKERVLEHRHGTRCVGLLSCGHQKKGKKKKVNFARLSHLVAEPHSRGGALFPRNERMGTRLLDAFILAVHCILVTPSLQAGITLDPQCRKSRPPSQRQSTSHPSIHLPCSLDQGTQH